jgi:hypothetical protein
MPTMGDITAEYVVEQHAYAKDLYSGALAMAAEVEELFKNDWTAPKDVDGNRHAATPDIMRPARARAIVEKSLSMLSLRATQTIEVVSPSLKEADLERSSKKERWAHGYQRGYMLETKRNPWRDAAYWFFLRGRGYLETRFDASYLNTDKLVIRTLADDPNTIFPVTGHDGIEWYTKEVCRSARSLKAEIKRRRGGAKKDRWKGVDLAEIDDNADVTIIEYWDEDYCAAVVTGVGDGGNESKLLYVRNHDYGFVPLAEADCMSTPLPDKEWAAQPVLYLIMDSLKGMYKLASKMATGVDLFYWPHIVYQTPSGSLAVLDSGAVGVETIIAPGSKYDVVQPQVNQAVLAQLMGWLQGDVQLGGIPDIAWGAEPSSLQSGFAVAQVLGQVMDKIAPHKEALEMAYGWDWSHKLRLIKKYGHLPGAYLNVPVERDYAKTDNVRNPVS